VDELGGIDVWVNDAAVMSYGEMTETPVKAQRRIVEVNLLGTMWGTRAALAVMQRQSRGVVVNVASLYGKVSTPFVSGYSASKFGIFGFSHAVRQELQRYPGVDLSVVLPGSIDTPIFRHAANYTGRRVKPVPPAASPDRVARAVVACARKPRRQVTVGQLQHLVAWGRAVMPGAYSTVAPRVMRFVAIGKEPEDPHDGNLYVAEPELDQVRGGWRNRLVRSTVAAAAIAPVAVAGARAARSRAGGG
jgi:short-subunit dehydrogenase